MKLLLLSVLNLYLIAAYAQDEIDCTVIYDELYQSVSPDFAGCAPEPISAQQCKGETSELEITNHNLLILLDASGSMAAEVGGEMKMEMAKEVLQEFISSLDENIQTGLIVFGHRGSNQERGKVESCNGVELIYPLSTVNKTSLEEAINSFQPTGYTPLATALELAQNTLLEAESEKNKNWIYLITDGEETCNGQPVDVARQIAKQGVETIVNVIGFDVAQAEQLKAVATAGGGEYFAVKNRQELNAFFDQRKETLRMISEYRNCLRDQKAVEWFHDHKERFKFYTCVRKQRNDVWLGIRKARFNFIKNKDPRKICNQQIDNWNDSWLDGVNHWLEVEMEQLAGNRDAGAIELQQMIEELEQQRQKVLGSKP